MDTFPELSRRDTLCVIIHFGDPTDTFECLSSLENEAGLDVAIVDNDPSQSFMMPAGLAPDTSVIQTGGEMGFAEANNFGVKTARQPHHRFVLLLNNDTVVGPGAITTMRSTLAEPGIGMVGPSMPYFDEPSRLWANGGKVSRLLVTIDGIRKPFDTSIADVDYLPGAAFLVSLDLWDDIGGLPERYFLAFEEAEFAMEVKKRGLRVVVNQKSTVLHKVGMSSDRQPMYFYNTVRNRVRFGEYLFGKNVGRTIGAISGLARSHSFLRLRLWLIAVRDEMRGVPLNRDALLRVRDRFSGK